MRNFHITLLLLCFFVTLPTSLANAAGSFSSIYIFGDSLSDTGNLAAIPDFSFLNQTPFDKGFSNGPRAVEVLAEQLGLSAKPSLHLAGLNAGTNYAVAGARARGNEVIDLRNQVYAFLSQSDFKAPRDALYVLFIGGNDIRDARDEKNGPKTVRTLIKAVKGIDEVIRVLIDHGAKSIFIVNASDLRAAPETKEKAQNTNAKKFLRLTRQKTKFFNIQLSRKLSKINQEFDVDLIEFDLFSFSRSVIKNHSALGFTNSKEKCFSSVTFTFNEACENGINFDEFIFFDEFHTTAKTNERVGQAFFSLVPEPRHP